MVEVLFLERRKSQLVGRWQPEGAASRLLRDFKVSVGELFSNAVSVKGED